MMLKTYVTLAPREAPAGVGMVKVPRYLPSVETPSLRK
jgi:hypothetical protein